MAMDLTLFLAFLGLVSVLRTTARLLRWLHLYFLRPSKSLRHYGSWALVTGATDGIGKAVAFQMARQGLNLILVSRNADKLESTANEIKNDVSSSSNYQVEIKTVAYDFSEDDMTTEGVRRIEEAVEGLDVGVLVNNAGAAYRRAVFFDEVELWWWTDVVRVNVEGTSWVSKVVMKGMVERGRGAVVNIGSGASCVLPSFPLSTVYSATKA